MKICKHVIHIFILTKNIVYFNTGYSHFITLFSIYFIRRIGVLYVLRNFIIYINIIMRHYKILPSFKSPVSVKNVFLT